MSPIGWGEDSPDSDLMYHIEIHKGTEKLPVTACGFASNVAVVFTPRVRWTFVHLLQSMSMKAHLLGTAWQQPKKCSVDHPIHGAFA